MSTPRLHAEDRRRQLLETALDFFAKKGFQGTTTKEIAAAAGVTEAIIFRHFHSKQELYTAVLDYHHESGEMAAVLDQWKSFMDAKDDPGLFRCMIQTIIEGHRKDARVKRALLFAALEGHQTGLEQHRQRSMPIFELLCQYVARRQSEGGIRPTDPGAILAAVFGMASQFATMTEFFGFQVASKDSDVVEAFLEILLHGVQPASLPEKVSQ